jgi:hypothetical protein
MRRKCSVVLKLGQYVIVDVKATEITNSRKMMNKFRGDAPLMLYVPIFKWAIPMLGGATDS